MSIFLWYCLKVLAYEEFDIEKPEEVSTSQVVYVYSGLTYSDNTLHGMVRLPVHLRYHKPASDMTYESVILKNPDVLIRCSGVYTLHYQDQLWACIKILNIE